MIHSKDNLLKLVEFFADQKSVFTISPKTYWDGLGWQSEGWKVEAKRIHDIAGTAEWCRTNDFTFHFYDGLFSFSDPEPVREPVLFWDTNTDTSVPYIPPSNVK